MKHGIPCGRHFEVGSATTSPRARASLVCLYFAANAGVKGGSSPVGLKRMPSTRSQTPVMSGVAAPPRSLVPGNCAPAVAQTITPSGTVARKVWWYDTYRVRNGTA
jgi:hypothetical protein